MVGNITVIEMDREITDNFLEYITDGRVGYYWEEGYFPTIEVFIKDKKKEQVESLLEFLNEWFSESVLKEQGDFNMESFSESYHRILYVFDCKNMGKELKEVIDMLSNFGHHKWEWQQTNNF